MPEERARRKGGGKYANDTSILGLKMSAVLDGAESHKLESPSTVTDSCQGESNRIIAADVPFSATC